MKKVGLLFAGQGSQYLGMGKSLYHNYSFVRDLFKEASEIINYNLEDIIFNNQELLNKTKYTQIAILVVSIAIYEVLKKEIDFEVVATAGFSLGEYTALYASGVFDFKDIVNLVKTRAELMEAASADLGGAMAAIIGMETDVLLELCREIGDCYIANYNTVGQVVISGVKENVKKVADIVTSTYRKRAIFLNVSGPFHSLYMRDAAKEYKEKLKDYKYNELNTKIIMNYNASELKIDEVFTAMEKQIYSPVYFQDSINKMISDLNINLFFEVGPGKVLSGFVRKIDRTKQVISFESLEDIKNYKELLNEIKK